MRQNAPAIAAVTAVAALAATLGTIVVLPNSAAAQSAPGTFAAGQAPIAPAASDSFLAMVEVRSTIDLGKDLEAVIGRISAAQARLERGQLLQARAQAHRKLKETEIASLQVRRELADKSKNELEKQMLESREDLRAREIDSAKADIEWGDSARRALELELNLASQREQRALLYGRTLTEAVGAEAQRLDKSVGEFEKKTLEAQIAEADKRKKSSERHVEVAKIRKKLFEAQQKVAAGV
jgi:hypothetical protein